MEDKKPNKGILKSSSSFDKQEKEQKRNKATKWDEMNIIATFHPADKDYGHMKVEEPKTPYNWNYDETDASQGGAPIDPDVLMQKLTGAVAGSSRWRSTPSASDDDEEDEDENLTEEERAKRREFKNRRKHHYNEFKAVQLARKLIEEEDDDENEDPGLPANPLPPADEV